MSIALVPNATGIEMSGHVSAATPYKDFLTFTEARYALAVNGLPGVAIAPVGNIEALPTAWKEELYAIDIARCAQRLRLGLDPTHAADRRYTWQIDSPGRGLGILRQVQISETGLSGTWQADKRAGGLTSLLEMPAKDCVTLVNIVRLAVNQLDGS